MWQVLRNTALRKEVDAERQPPLKVQLGTSGLKARWSRKCGLARICRAPCLRRRATGIAGGVSTVIKWPQRGETRETLGRELQVLAVTREVGRFEDEVEDLLEAG